MLLLRTFCLISALSCGLTESPFRNNREFHYQDGYPSRERNRSSGVGFPRELDKEFRNGLDLRGSPEAALERELHENYIPLGGSEPVRVFSTRGKGKAVVQRGGTVEVPTQLNRKRAHKGTVSVRVVEGNESEVKRHRGGCRECPADQTVVASKGNSFAVLPEPCPQAPRMWSHLSGPKPGNKVPEGVHTIRGNIGAKKRFCEYRYQVLVNRCEELKAEDDATLECSAGNVWGSICIVSCGKGKEAVGPTDMHCQENLLWSNPMPECRSTGGCTSPKVKSKSKISCQAANASLSEGDHLPNGSICKFRQNGKSVVITCKDGRWLKPRKGKPLPGKQATPGKNDVCNPNPCQNGGTCLKPESNKGPPICKCRPQTQGVHCELRECYYNVCENDGLCIYQNEERTCYCSPEYSGERCQTYEPH